MVDPRRRRPDATATVLDFWERAALGLPRRRHPPGVGHGHRRAIYDDDIVAALLAGAVPIDDDEHRAAGEALQRHAREPPVPALLRHPGGLRRHRARTPCPATRTARCSCATSTASAEGDFPWSDGRQGRALPPPHRGAGARRRAEHLHRLRHVEPHARGLPRPAGRLRALHHRRAAARASSGRCPPTSTTASSPPCRKAQAQHYRNIAAMDAGREDPRRRLRVLHASCARSPRSPGSPTSSTGRCPATCPSRSYELLSAMQGENAGVPEDEAYYELYPEDAP